MNTNLPQITPPHQFTRNKICSHNIFVVCQTLMTLSTSLLFLLWDVQLCHFFANWFLLPWFLSHSCASERHFFPFMQSLTHILHGNKASACLSVLPSPYLHHDFFSLSSTTIPFFIFFLHCPASFGQARQITCWPLDKLSIIFDIFASCPFNLASLVQTYLNLIFSFLFGTFQQLNKLVASNLDSLKVNEPCEHIIELTLRLLKWPWKSSKKLEWGD